VDFGRGRIKDLGTIWKINGVSSSKLSYLDQVNICCRIAARFSIINR